MVNNKYESTNKKIPLLRWSNRRRMAWWAFGSLLVGTFIFWFALPLFFHLFDLPTVWLSFISESYSWFASAQTVVITAYMGFNSITNRRLPIPKIGGHQSEDEVDYDNNDQDEEIYDPNSTGR